MNRKLLYGSLAKIYDMIYSGKKYVSETKKIISVFKKFKVLTVLDVGCGTGTHASILVNHGFEVTGIDSSKSMIKLCKKKVKNKNAKFYIKNMVDFNFNNKFDACICLFSTILYNTTNEDLIKCIKNIRKHLKAKGIFIVVFSTPLSFTPRTELIKGTKFETRKHDFFKPELQKIISKNEYFEYSSRRKLGEDTSIKRILFPQEAKFFLKQAGFSTIEEKTKKRSDRISTTLIARGD